MNWQKVLFMQDIEPDNIIKFSFHGRNKHITHAKVLSVSPATIVYITSGAGSIGELRPCQLQTLKVYKFIG